MKIGLLFYLSIGEPPETNTDYLILITYIAAALVMFFLVPLCIQRTLRKHKNGLYLTYNRKKFGSLYLGINTKEYSSIFNVFIYLAVRLSFVILTYALIKVPGILVNVYMLFTNFNIIYVGWVRPYSTNA